MRFLFLLLLIAPLAVGETLTLTDKKGRTITATVSEINDTQIQVIKDGKKFSIQRADLDDASQAAVAGAAAKVANEVRVTMRAKVLSASRTADERWKTDWGSYDRDTYRSRSVGVDVECSKGDQEGYVTIQWLAREVSGQKDKGIAQIDKKPITLKPSNTYQVTFDALFYESDTNYEALDYRDRSGLKFSGWIVRVVTKDGTVVAEQSSNPVNLEYPPLTAEELADDGE